MITPNTLDEKVHSRLCTLDYQKTEEYIDKHLALRHLDFCLCEDEVLLEKSNTPLDRKGSIELMRMIDMVVLKKYRLNGWTVAEIYIPWGCVTPTFRFQRELSRWNRFKQLFQKKLEI